MTLNLEYQLVDLNAIHSEGTDSMSEMARDRITKKWEVFAGRNRFYCDGRLMTAPNGGVFLLTVFLITGTCALFFIFDCSYLATNVTIAIPIIGGLLFIFTMSSLLRTSLSDPGIIPRATPEEAAYVEKQIGSADPPRSKKITICFCRSDQLRQQPHLPAASAHERGPGQGSDHQTEVLFYL
jgi:hypothetical protein